MKKNRAIKVCLIGFFTFTLLFCLLVFKDDILAEQLGGYLIAAMIFCIGGAIGKTVSTGILESKFPQKDLIGK